MHRLPSRASLPRHPQKHLCIRVSTPTYTGSFTRTWADFCNRSHARLFACTCTVSLFCIANCTKGYRVPMGRDWTTWLSSGGWSIYFLSVETVNSEEKLNEVSPPKHLILTEEKCWQQGNTYTVKFAYDISVLLKTLARASFTGTCAKQHRSPKHIVGRYSCGEKDGHCRWGRFFTSRWSVQPPWRMTRSAVTSCSALVCVRWVNIPRPIFAAETGTTDSAEKPGPLRAIWIMLQLGCEVHWHSSQGMPGPHASCAILVLGQCTLSLLLGQVLQVICEPGFFDLLTWSQVRIWLLNNLFAGRHRAARVPVHCVRVASVCFLGTWPTVCLAPEDPQIICKGYILSL